MFRNAVSRPLLRVNQRLTATRSFSVASVRMGEGDTGAPRAGGVQSGYAIPSMDSFYYVAVFVVS
jgi:ATPase inhibitor, mitochondrial